MFVLLDDQVSHRQLYFSDPVDVITYTMGEPVEPLFEKIEQAQHDGLWIAGLFHYEFGAALEPKLSYIAKRGHELVRLGVFKAPSDHPPVECLYAAAPPEVKLKPRWSERRYLTRFRKVQTYLRAGDAYQINLTFPMTGNTDADAKALYAGYRRRQPGRYGAIISLGGADVVSFSPELFFQKTADSMRMRPMKGTRPLGSDDDMTADEKSRAENLMIVDLLRNDLSRLCKHGTVKVPELFSIEDYPTVRQMTSQVVGSLRDGVSWQDIFQSLFPCGSVTGAPKIRAMEIIHELESGPRGAYCGSIGYISPNGDAGFSVAIRTAMLDKGNLRYDVGSGVVLDSDGRDEYQECLLKASLLEREPERAIETFRYCPEDGFVRAERHARRFYAARPNGSFYRAVDQIGADEPLRVSLSAADDGITQCGTTPFVETEGPLKLALSRYPLTPDVQRTDIKSSYRDFYDGERARVSALTGADEVVFLGADGLIKEGSFTSLFIQKNGQWLTPKGPGLLPGILREEMIDLGEAMEADLHLEDLLQADEVCVGNSLRGLMTARLITANPV